MQVHKFNFSEGHTNYLFLVLEFEYKGVEYKAALTEAVLYDGSVTGDYKVVVVGAEGTLSFDIEEFEDEGDLSISPILELKQIIRKELHKLGK